MPWEIEQRLIMSADRLVLANHAPRGAEESLHDFYERTGKDKFSFGVRYVAECIDKMRDHASLTDQEITVLLRDAAGVLERHND